MPIENKSDVEILRSVIRALEHSAHQRLADKLRDLILTSQQRDAA
jgi:hypothetical protein